jgi:Domain of unknown function (DUF4394)
MKKSLATLTFTALALAAMAIPSIMNRYSASAESKLDLAPVASAAAQDVTLTAQAQGVTVPNRNIYALNNNNVLFVMRAGTTSFTRVARLQEPGGNGNFIDIDFRPLDRKLYALTDEGNLYTVALGAANAGALTKESTLSPVFKGGYQSVMDFNPMVDAIRLLNTEQQNYAVVKGANGVLNTTAVQTSLTYPAPDVNAGKDPNIACGAYTNNVAGATVTIIYMIDHALDTFVTIPPAAAGGPSATGGGLLQTIGNLVTPAGARVNISPTADCDVFTNANGVNFLVGVSGNTLFSIDLNQINPNQQRGQTKNVVVRGLNLTDEGGGMNSLAVQP